MRQWNRQKPAASSRAATASWAAWTTGRRGDGSEQVEKSGRSQYNLEPALARWSQQAVGSIWAPGRTSKTPVFVQDALRGAARGLEAKDDRAGVESRFGADFSRVLLHVDDTSESAERLGAAAYTAGRHIVFARGQYVPGTESGRRLLSHELAHVLQQRQCSGGVDSEMPTTMRRDQLMEHFAESWAVKREPALCNQRSGSYVVPSIAEKILKFAAKKLEKRTVKTVSKHIGWHAAAHRNIERIAKKAVHLVFKNPREIRYLIQRTINEAITIAAKHPAAGSGIVIEEAGIRITRQVKGPGKFRLLIEKTFGKEIGTKGERVLSLVVDQSGRIVTAFPGGRLAVLGLTAAGVEALTEGTAQAGEALQASVEKAAEDQKGREDRTDLWDWVPGIGDIWGGSLNEGEYEMLREDREIAKLIDDIITDVENSEQRTLGLPERRELEQLIRTAVSSPLIMEDTDLAE